MRIAVDEAPAISRNEASFLELSLFFFTPLLFVDCKTIRRNGEVVGFKSSSASVALTKAFLAGSRWSGCYLGNDGDESHRKPKGIFVH